MRYVALTVAVSGFVFVLFELGGAPGPQRPGLSPTNDAAKVVRAPARAGKHARASEREQRRQGEPKPKHPRPRPAPRIAAQGPAPMLAGAPQAWPAETPERMTERGFRAAIDDVFATCKIPAQSNIIDCAEPPCMIALDGVGFEYGPDKIDALIGCPAWKERFGAGMMGKRSELTCDGGSTQPAYVASPVWPSFMRAGTQADRQDRSQRLSARTEQLERQLCGMREAP